LVSEALKSRLPPFEFAPSNPLVVKLRESSFDGNEEMKRIRRSPSPLAKGRQFNL
jgi:hypothetical protein